jgi:hypothetical protein
MGDGFVVDVAALRDVARGLRTVSDALAGSDLGPAPDAGASSAELARVLRALADARAAMAEAVECVADNLDRCAADYSAVDDASAERVLRFARDTP